MSPTPRRRAPAPYTRTRTAGHPTGPTLEWLGKHLCHRSNFAGDLLLVPRGSRWSSKGSGDWHSLLPANGYVWCRAIFLYRLIRQRLHFQPQVMEVALFHSDARSEAGQKTHRPPPERRPVEQCEPEGSGFRESQIRRMEVSLRFLLSECRPIADRGPAGSGTGSGYLS